MAEIRRTGFYYPADNEDDEDGADHEPWLGFLEPHLTGMEHDWWFATYSDDARQNVDQGCTDDREDDTRDIEPSLCGVTASAVTQLEGV